jgi:hypothetical protein
MRRLLTYCAKARLILVLGELPFLLAACGDLTRSIEPPQLDPVPAALAEPCPRTVVMPVRNLTQQESEAFWIQDRRHLIECADSKQAVVKYYAARDAAITGKP